MCLGSLGHGSISNLVLMTWEPGKLRKALAQNLARNQISSVWDGIIHKSRFWGRPVSLEIPVLVAQVVSKAVNEPKVPEMPIETSSPEVLHIDKDLPT